MLQPCRPVREPAGSVDLGCHVGELELDRLEVGDPLAELPALERIATGLVVRRLRDPDRLCGDPDASAVERVHRDRESPIHIVQKPVGAHPAPAMGMSAVEDEWRPSFSSSRVTSTWSASRGTR